MIEGEAAAGWEPVLDAFADAQARDPGSAQLSVQRRGDAPQGGPRPTLISWTGPSSGPRG